MKKENTILIVDDSVNEIHLLMEILGKTYAVLAATDADKTFSALNNETKPDLVLMDVNMEPVNGYDLTQQLLEMSPGLAVIFVSANDTTQEMLKGFSVGGVDYITKPFDPDILLSKVELTLKQIELRQNLEQEKAQASNMMMTAITSAGDLGVIIDFLRNGLKAGNPGDLAQKLTESLSCYDLESSVRLNNGEDNTYSSSAGALPPLEVELLNRTCDMEQRMLEIGRRLIVDNDTVSILIKNMPTDNERCGELRDYVTMLAEDANILNKKLYHEIQIAQQRSKKIVEALIESQNALKTIENFQKQSKEAYLQIIDNVAIKVDDTLVRLGLTEEQEETISSIIQNGVEEVLTHVENSLQIDEQLKVITAQLGELAKSE